VNDWMVESVQIPCNKVAGYTGEIVFSNVDVDRQPAIVYKW